jgi:Tol biopolymer transport system component
VHQWTSDGKILLTSQGTRSLNLVALAGEGIPTSATGKPKMLFSTTYQTGTFQVSPDGKWIAYTSQETGSAQVVVATFPGFTDRRQISIAPSAQPVWRSDGKELFFIQRDFKLMAVDVTTRSSTLDSGPIRMLFPVSAAVGTLQARTYAVARDGRRFLIRDLAGTNQVTAEQLYVVMNWTSLVGR